jgi:hypothetical protein
LFVLNNLGVSGKDKEKIVMQWRVTFLALSVLAMESALLAQHNCPEGFRYVGKMSGTGSYGSPFKEKRELILPEGATLDTSYQQKQLRARSGNEMAQSKLVATDIPKGILIITYGSTTYDQGWAVSAPQLRLVQPGDNSSPPRYAFGMQLYCTATPQSSYMQYGGCDVNVEVCYKSKK